MDEDFKKDLDERLNGYPPNMHAEDVAEFLGISMTSAYRLFDSEDSPKLNVPGVRKKRSKIFVSGLDYENFEFQ